MIGLLVLGSACAPAPVIEPADDAPQIVLEPVGPDPAAVEALAASLPGAVAEGGHHVVLLRFELPGLPTDDTFVAALWDYTAGGALRAEGRVADGLGGLRVAPSVERPPPSLEEWEEAIDVVRRHPTLGPDLVAGRLEPFLSMPQLAGGERRAITVGLRGEGRVDEIVSVDLGSGEVLQYAGGAPPTARVGGLVCNPPPASPQLGLGRGAQGWARVRIVQRGQELWSAIVRRPSASSGVDGSGVELGEVRLRGKLLLRQAHVPFLNVQYDGDACGPFRDHQWQENPFLVGPTRQQLGPGIRVVDWAKTMRETRDDHGNFTGVAVYWDAAHAQGVLLSELEAGWYRYMSEWRLGADGSLTGRWGFDAVANGCTCNVHNHHASWRLDFQIGSGDDRVEQYDGGAWALVDQEGERDRDDAGGRLWRVSDPVSGDAVRVEPGPGEDPHDLFSVGDVWVLRAHPDEVDDLNLQPRPSVQTYVPAFVDGEPVVDADLLMWWSGHFRHDDTNPAGNLSHTVEVRIVPEVW